MRDSGRTVLGYFFDFDRQEESPYRGESAYSLVQRAPEAVDGYLPLGRSVTQNLPNVAEAAAGLGYFNFLPDEDGIYRHAQLGIRFGDRIALPLSLAMLQRALPDRTPAIRFGPFGVESVRFGTEAMPVDEDGQLLISYRGPGKTFPHISAADVLGGRVPAETFHDKLVAARRDRDWRRRRARRAVRPRLPRRRDPRHGARQHPARRLSAAALMAGPGRRCRYLALALVARPRAAVHCAASAACWSRWRPWSATSSAASGVHPHRRRPQHRLPGAGHRPHVRRRSASQHYVAVDREKRHTRRMLDLYLSPSLAAYVSERPETLKLGGEKSDRTVLFSDIKGFTTISERLEPEQLVELLNVYLGEMTDIVFAHDGMLDKYIGDGVMAVWGAPIPQADHAARACRAALAMIERLGKLNDTIAERGWPKLSIRIGLNSGPMVFGNIGVAGPPEPHGHGRQREPRRPPGRRQQALRHRDHRQRGDASTLARRRWSSRASSTWCA